MQYRLPQAYENRTPKCCRGDRPLGQVNAFYQTSNPQVYACGDVIGYPALASTSMEQVGFQSRLRRRGSMDDRTQKDGC